MNAQRRQDDTLRIAVERLASELAEWPKYPGTMPGVRQQERDRVAARLTDILAAHPAPSCEYGYTSADLDTLIGVRGTSQRDRFGVWMRGQTVMLCDEHGVITYRSDVEQYLRGGRPLD